MHCGALHAFKVSTSTARLQPTDQPTRRMQASPSAYSGVVTHAAAPLLSQVDCEDRADTMLMLFEQAEFSYKAYRQNRALM